MKIEKSIVQKLKMTGVYGLDPISVFLEDYEPGKGKITISCYDKSWHSYWGGMSGRSISDFFLSCDNYYITKNLSSVSSEINDYESLGKKIRDFYKEKYDIDDYETYEILQNVESMGCDEMEWEGWIRNDPSVMCEVFGDEWWRSIPTKTNPEYKYLCRIIDAVKDALRSLKDNQED